MFRNRWRTLLSVDDLIDGVMTRLDELNVLGETYVIFTSDHGYHLGTFALTHDKRMPYETGPNLLLYDPSTSEYKERIYAFRIRRHKDTTDGSRSRRTQGPKEK